MRSTPLLPVVIAGLLSLAALTSAGPAECPLLAPADFDCTRAGYFKCEADYPSETGHYERPASIPPRSVAANATANYNTILRRFRNLKGWIHEVNPEKEGQNNETALDARTEQNGVSQLRSRQTRRCCRPTWECYDFMTAVKTEVVDGFLVILDHEEFRKAHCCLQKYWEPTDECPDGPLREIPDDWKEPPACSEDSLI